jgi:methyltransferase
MALPLFVLSVIIGLLLAETRLSSTHEARLRAHGAIAPAGDVYAALAVAYPAAFVAMGVEGMARQTPPEGLFASGVLMFVASKALKYWAIGALGERWSFRVLVLPGAPLVSTGPYRYVAHPNYVAVLGELAGTAMMMNARLSGPIAFCVFGVILWLRIRFETEALRKAYEKIEASALRR